MKALRVCAISALVLLSFTAANGPAGSGNAAGCGTSLSIRDPLLRAQFAALDRHQAADFAELCASYRQGGAKLR